MMSDPHGYYLLAFTSKIVEVFLVAIIHGPIKGQFHKRESTPNDYLRILIFPFITLLSSTVMLNAFLNYPETAPHLLICVLFLLFFDVAAIILLNHIEHQQQALTESRILQQELKLAQDSISMLAASYSNERRLTHDFQNKLLTIQGLIEQDKSGLEASAYLKSLVNQNYSPSLPISTHRIVVDVILNRKYQTAQEKQIVFNAHLDDLSTFPIPDDAFVVILSNLLDNAIEACEKIENVSSRKITLKAKSSHEEAILCIENSVNQPVKIIDNKIVSTKTNPFHHGYGLQNVFSLVNANGGLCTIR